MQAKCVEQNLDGSQPLMICFRAFLRLHCGNPVGGKGEPYAEAAFCRCLQRPGWESTSQDGEFPTGVGHGFIAVDPLCKWELKQGARKGLLGCDCEQRRPSRDPGRLRSRTEMNWHGGWHSRRKGCSLGAKASAYLDADDNKAATARTCQFRVCVASSAPLGIVRDPSQLCVSSVLRPSRPHHGRDYGGIKGDCDPCHEGRPLATTSMRRASATGTSMFMSATRTFRETRAPASRRTHLHSGTRSQPERLPSGLEPSSRQQMKAVLAYDP